MSSYDYDAVVVGAGANGLSAAITLQQAGLSVLLLEGSATVGGGTRTVECTLPGFKHDLCSAIHPLAAGSPFFATLPLQQFGLEFIDPPVPAAHPFDHQPAAALLPSVEETAQALGADATRYRNLLQPLVQLWPMLADSLLGPFQPFHHPLAMARFGSKALLSSTSLIQRFSTTEMKGLLAGMAAHSMQPLTNRATAAVALVLMINAHVKGWPIIKGGSSQLAQALADYFVSLGGKIITGFYVQSLQQLPSSRTILFDVTPKQLLQIAGHRFSSFYRWQLNRYRYGMGVYKIDWALDAPIPFSAPVCNSAGTVHIGNTAEEIIAAEQQTWEGKHPDKPFVLLAQQSLFDASRAPAGKHTAWAYCHVPNGSTQNMTEAIEQQVERFAPGFRERILARHVMNSAQLEAYNPNYIGGDINGGVQDLRQLFTRPALRWSPYRTSAKGLYLCSSSTPPGGGVHGMCGFHAARRALKDIFKI